MARPREFDRDEALAKARDAFWTRGYEGTSMADLVSELGIASARIYAAFGSKEDLFREAIGLYEVKEGGFVDRALAQEPTARLAVARMLREAVETYTRPGKPWGCMVVTAATNCAAENSRVQEWLAERTAPADRGRRRPAGARGARWRAGRGCRCRASRRLSDLGHARSFGAGPRWRFQ